MRASHALFAVVATVLLINGVLADESIAKPQEAVSKPQKASFLQLASPSSSYYGRRDVKHLRMKQSSYEFTEVGCGDVERCATGTCTPCVSEILQRSKLTCWNDKEEMDSTTSMTPPSIGRCEWQFNVYQCPDSSGSSGSCFQWDTTVEGLPGTGGIEIAKDVNAQLGSAWATCYLNSDSETCGDGFCGQMVLSFQGSLHLVQGAYIETDDGQQLWRQPGKAGLLKKLKESSLGQRIADKHPNAIKPPAPGDAKNQAPGSDTEYYLGAALVVTGPVQVTATSRSYEWTHGMLQWVVDCDIIDGTAVSNPPTGAYVYTPHTYELTLTSNSSPYKSEYDGGDE